MLAPKYRTKDNAYKVGLKLLSNAAAKLRRLNMWARGIGVTISFIRRFQEARSEEGPSGWNAHTSIHACRDTMTLQDHFRRLWRDCPPNVPLHVGVWLFDLIPDQLHSLGLFEDEKRETVSSIMDQINKRFGQHTVYLGGLHGLADAAPTRIPFFSVPELSDF